MSKDWKDVLLRSGVPLEHEVACVLADHGFQVEADFPYLRRDGESDKEHSVDLSGTWFGERGSKLPFAVHLLVECKYRSPEKKLLLLQEPGEESLVILGGTVVGFDELVPFHLKSNCFVELEREYPTVYKGVELHGNEAVERDFRRGIEQLRYGTPAAIMKAIDFSLCSHVSDAHAFFFGKVLVTNATMLLATADMDVARIQGAKKIEEVSEPVEGAILCSDYGPDYERHFSKVFEPEKNTLLRWGRILERYVTEQGKGLDPASGPTRFFRNLCDADRWECGQISRQFFISSTRNLPELVRRILEGCKEAYRGRDRKKARTKRTG